MVGFSQMLKSREHLSEIQELRDANLIVAWSLGSLLTLRGPLPPKVPLVVLTPIADFCHPELGWPVRVLKRMITKLEQSPQSVLEVFAKQMDIPEFNRSLWVKQALGIPAADLSLGLELLAHQTVSNLDSLATQRPIHMIYGGQDQIVAPKLCHWLEEKLQPTSVQFLPDMPHWPFAGDWTLPLL